MKILLCTTTFKIIANGPTKFANFLYVNGSRNNDPEIHILTEDANGDRERLYECKLGIIKKILPLAPVYRMFKYYRRANQLNKKYQFDYVIYNNAIYGVLHGFLKSNVAGMINDYSNQTNIEKSSLFNYAYLKKSIFKHFEKLAISHLSLIITNSDFLTLTLSKNYPKEAAKIFRLYKGIDIKYTLRNNNYDWDVQSLKEIKILFIKNDFVTGGLEILSKSLSLINLKFSLTIIGPDLKYKDQIKSFFRSSNVALNIMGRQSQEKVYDCMATHQIFCVPSLQEALGVANLEALNIGISVVSSDAGGIPEVLDYGNCGFLSKAGDADSLTDSLKQSIYNREERKKKILNGFEHVNKFKDQYIPENLKKILNDQV
jgi:glycosyltransferase involved in cell wall biosynthesis